MSQFDELGLDDCGVYGCKSVSKFGDKVRDEHAGNLKSVSLSNSSSSGKVWVNFHKSYFWFDDQFGFIYDDLEFS